MIDYSKWIKKVEVPSWDEYFLILANDIKIRSKDANTKHGCVLVDENNHIIGTGYNSFPRDFWDDLLPNNRISHVEPNCPKYDWMIHAEDNAIKNITTKNYRYLTSYQTGFPCHNCLIDLHQVRTRRVVISNKTGWQFSKDETQKTNITLQMSGIRIETLTEEYIGYSITGKDIFFQWRLK